MKKSNKEFLPVWGYWLIGSVLLGMLVTLLGLNGTLRQLASAAHPKPAAPAIIAPVVEVPITASPIPVPPAPPPQSKAQIFLESLPDAPLSAEDGIRKQIALLAMKDPLWVNDFRDLYKTTQDQKSMTAPIFIQLFFGKPDSEWVHDTEREFLGIIHRYHIQEPTYQERIVNPTTGKKESLTFVYVDFKFDGVKSIASGHSYP